MPLQHMNIAIIGAGIGGLTAAIALKRHGAAVTVFEQAPEISEVGAGIQISANAIRVLTKLGLTPFEWPYSAPKAVHLCDYKMGRVVSKVDLNTSRNEPFLQFHRADLIGALYDEAQRSGVGIKLGQTIDNLTTNGDLAGQEYDLIVGADGVRSQTRGTFFKSQAPVFTGQVAWRAILDADATSAQFQNKTHVFMGPHKHVVIYPLRGSKQINIVAVEERAEWVEEGWNHLGDPKQLCTLFKGWADPLCTLLQKIDAPIAWGLFAHPSLETWANDRIVLLGDSTHPMVPFIAQGACMAIEDAWVLADQLVKKADISQSLQAYEAIRKPRATKVQETALKSGRIYHEANSIKRKILHTGMQIASRIAPQIIARHYDWIYDYDVTKSGV